LEKRKQEKSEEKTEDFGRFYSGEVWLKVQPRDPVSFVIPKRSAQRNLLTPTLFAQSPIVETVSGTRSAISRSLTRADSAGRKQVPLRCALSE